MPNMPWEADTDAIEAKKSENMPLIFEKIIPNNYSLNIYNLTKLLMKYAYSLEPRSTSISSDASAFVNSPR